MEFTKVLYVGEVRVTQVAVDWVAAMDSFGAPRRVAFWGALQRQPIMRVGDEEGGVLEQSVNCEWRW